MTERTFEHRMMKEIRGYVKENITAGAASWLDDAKICFLSEGALVIDCGSIFAAAVVETRLKPLIEKAVCRLFGMTPVVHIVTAEEAAVWRTKAAAENNE